MNGITITCDGSPFILFVELLDRFLKGVKRALDLGDLGGELCRVESDYGSAGAGKCVVRLYPSDGLLRYAATALAGEVNLDGVDTGIHGDTPLPCGGGGNNEKIKIVIGNEEQQ